MADSVNKTPDFLNDSVLAYREIVRWMNKYGLEEIDDFVFAVQLRGAIFRAFRGMGIELWPADPR